MATRAQLNTARQQVEDLRAKRANDEAKAKLRARAAKAADTNVVEDDETTMPSGRRVLIGTVLGVASGVGAGYGVSALMAYAVAAATIYTASTFLATLIWVIGCVLAIYAGLKTASTVFGYVVTAKDREHAAMLRTGASNLRDRVRGMWNNETAEA